MKRSTAPAVFLYSLVALTLSCTALAQDGNLRVFQPEDVHRMKSVGDITVSPDGNWIAYTVGTTNVEKDYYSSDLPMVS